jgi:hypothetical protein
MSYAIARRILIKSIDYLKSNLDHDTASSLFLDGEDEFTEDQLFHIELAMDSIVFQLENGEMTLDISSGHILSEHLTQKIMGSI